MSMNVGVFDVDHVFDYHSTTPGQRTKYEALRASAKDLAETILRTTPQSADQTAALRKVREAVMTANAAIALGGRFCASPENVAQPEGVAQSHQCSNQFSVCRYKKKGLVIEAIQWFNDKIVCPPGPVWFSSAMERDEIRFSGDRLYVKTLEGEMAAEPGDWIIRSIEGELYPCKPDIFDAFYDPVDCHFAGADGASDG